MDRFLSLKKHRGSFMVSAGGLVLFISLSAVVRADPPPMSAQNNVPATNAAPTAVMPPKPPQVPDEYNRYGKIWAPSDDVAHPLKLNWQFPGVGEMKVPSQEELNMRDKLEKLAQLSDEDIRKQLDQWPPYAKMKLGDQGQMLVRIQQFKDLRTRVAMDKARQLGLLTLTPEQKARFEKEYWDKRLQMDREVAKQVEPIVKARMQKMQDELFREFSTPGPVSPPAPPQQSLAQGTNSAPVTPPAPAPVPTVAGRPPAH